MVLTMCAGTGQAQIEEQFVVHTFQNDRSSYAALRFDRRLRLLGVTSFAGLGGGVELRSDIVVDGSGTYSIEYDPLNAKKVLRMTSDGTLLPVPILSHNPVGLTVNASGEVFALTRVPLLAPGKMSKLTPGGLILWSTWKASGLYVGNYPEFAVVTADGELWIAGSSKQLCPACAWQPLLVHVDQTSGSVLDSLELPFIDGGFTAVWHAAGAPDGSLWIAELGPPGSELMLARVDDGMLLDTFPVDAGGTSLGTQIRVDALGRIWIMGETNTTLRAFDPSTGAVLDEVNAGGLVIGFALGPTGEEAFVASNSTTVPLLRRLTRVNLVTGVRSSVPLDPPWAMSAIGFGDPTGFIFANVVDQRGDNDGDGATNREETLAGSSPFDPLSRPEGPKVYLSFAQSNNAIILKIVDQDGLLDPVGGLDASSIALTLGPYGDVWNVLLPFLSFVQVSPDLTEATAVFGALPIAQDKQWEVLVSVADLSGAVGWDWQVTPPGEL